MNSASELLIRLLEGYPVDLLKSFFGYKGNKESVIIDIVKNNNPSQIEQFVADYFGHIHQHVIIRELNSGIGQSLGVLMAGKNIIKKVSQRKSNWFYLHKTSLSYFNPLSGKNEDLEFFVPVKIETFGKIMIIYYNILARDIQTYFKHKIYSNRSNNLESQILDEINSNLGQITYKYDLNKGVKFLWNADYLDAVIVKNKKSKSVKVERMDQNFTYKKHYIKDWNNLMLTPIQKTKFVALNPLIEAKIFDIDPTNGTLNFSNFLPTNKGVEKLVYLILQNN